MSHLDFDRLAYPPGLAFSKLSAARRINYRIAKKLK